MSRNSVRYSSWLGAGRRRGRISSPGRAKNFHFSMSSSPALGSTELPIEGKRGVKRQGHEADHSGPSSAEVKKMWMYTYTSTPLVYTVNNAE
jgi:hypothetical protein